MHKALHPYKNIKISVSDHIREFGNDTLSLNERARCPLCKEPMVNRATSSPGATGHFAHMPKSGYCPTKEQSGLPYLGKHPRRPDPEAAQRMKAIFATNWEKHYLRLDNLVKGLSVLEFRKVLTIAGEERIWEYAGLEEYQLPYIFATLMDYPSTSSFCYKGQYARKCWFRCWFDSTIQRYDDLWIQRAEPVTLTRAWYKQPTRGKPKLESLIDCYSIEMTSDFLSDSKKSAPYVVDKLDTWVKNRFQSM